jgi:hypothetical protein
MQVFTVIESYIYIYIYIYMILPILDSPLSTMNKNAHKKIVKVDILQQKCRNVSTFLEGYISEFTNFMLSTQHI